jgi:RNA polymerase sigma factor (sigma-70 family)
MGTNHIDTSRTSQSLVDGVRDPGNQQAWAEFHRQYEPMIRGWCRHWFPRETDDMDQEVFRRLVNCLKKFEYDPAKRFRGYLKTVTNNLMAELKERESRRPAIDHEFLVEQVEAGQDLVDRLKAEYDFELRDIARERVRGRVEERTWSAYVETAERWRSPEEVANELGMKVGAVYQAKHSVQEGLKKEIAILEGLQ